MADETEPESADAGASALEGGTRTHLQPPPTEQEVAAILAAIEVAWPKPVVAVAEDPRPSRWRFSGRWWSAPVPLRRVRPW